MVEECKMKKCWIQWEYQFEENHYRSCVKQLLKMVPNNTHLLICMLYVIPSPWVWAVSINLLLLNRIQQKSWDVTFEIRLLNIVTSTLFAPSLFLALIHFEGSQLPCVSYSMERGPSGKKLRKAFNNSPWGTEALSPIACEERNSANNFMGELGSRFSPSQALRWDCSPSWHVVCNLLETLIQRTWLSCSHISDPQKMWDNKYHCLKPLNFREIC